MKKYLPVQRKRQYKLRSILDAIFWCLRLGNQWRNLPDNHPDWRIFYYYFRRWKQDGTLRNINLALKRWGRERRGKKATTAMFCIDSQSIKVAPFISVEKGLDENKNINGRERHVITDTLGLVWGVVVHSANKADRVMAEKVITPLQGYMHWMKKILADDAYKKVFINRVNENLLGVDLQISSKPPGAEGFVPVKWRWVNERTFGSFNFFRRLDKDHEKTIESSEAWVLWQNCQMILNRLDPNN